MLPPVEGIIESVIGSGRRQEQRVTEAEGFS